ncbi:hypothetical protein QBC42DRAFT_280754 [Cladorrhinum samala]|uniref:Uncharacterized protein n=1 Tax=Cladorrhinum samala TaxID=585594 RepID=A0AAV9H7L2_9PEZI|nr:hypothetical protein QBC42DRAFT_280754 [Cladorrhinum samala]
MEPTAWFSLQQINLTTLDQLEISYLAEFIRTQGSNTTRNATNCKPASRILPLSNLSSLIIEPTPYENLTVGIDPVNLDVGIIELVDMAKGLFPFPLNNSGVGDVTTWWTNATINDNAATKDFLSAVVNMCGGGYCKSGYINVGNQDIVGIGMILAIVMLLFLTLAFCSLSFGPVIPIVARPSKKKRFSFRAACIGTVDELFSAVFVFALALIVSTFVFRYKTDSRFDALMANALSQLCATTVVMLAASYWAHNRERPHATGSVAVIAILTIAMFATHATVANMHASAAELACGIGSGRISTIRGDPFDMKKFHFVPVGFGAFCLALFGSVFHHPWVHRHRPTKEKGSFILWRVLWKIAQSLPSVAGLIGLVVYAAYFLNTWQMMKQTYGATFSKNVKNWGFGQYLAIFTWLPPVLSFMHIFFGGMEMSLEKKLPQGWRVIRESRDDEEGGGEKSGSPRVVADSANEREMRSLLGKGHTKKNKSTSTPPQTTYYQFPSNVDQQPESHGVPTRQTGYPDQAYSPDHIQGYQIPGFPSPSVYPPTPREAPGFFQRR